MIAVSDTGKAISAETPFTLLELLLNPTGMGAVDLNPPITRPVVKEQGRRLNCTVLLDSAAYSNCVW